ncbi:helix-hairpin-helix domain-containing protein [Streptobacillus moniliformis]|uniref:helix-hairpin-helix domain-containing protein n=1 Tax=Streptobacillus moniliformis TaxID=34105 RepID=UPI0007E3AACF|nr:helix-hairpin-helix domain-containing protein [Streptobacillus moniliformis]QXW65176.1 helix-hairpin-helix domain-containing protein [Streptobacillus moniliformis]
MKKLKYILSILLFLFLFNIIKNIFGIDEIGNRPNVEINDELIFQYENEEEKKLDINTASFDDIVYSGLSSKLGYKIIEYRDFVGYIDNLENLVRIRGINKNNIDKLRKNFYVEEISDKKYMKYNINDLDESSLYTLGFSKKEIKSIIDIRNFKKIRSELDLKDKVNMEIINKHIRF